MARSATTTRKKKPAKVKFELTRGSIFGTAVIAFCLFLWMFLIGVWTGQSILSPHPAVKSLTDKKARSGPPPFIKAVDKKKIVLVETGKSGKKE